LDKGNIKSIDFAIFMTKAQNRSEVMNDLTMLPSESSDDEGMDGLIYLRLG
jgi:hypothetical protein